MATVDLVLVTDDVFVPPGWDPARCFLVERTIAGVQHALKMTRGDWVLVWDAMLGEPPAPALAKALSCRTGDVWHAGRFKARFPLHRHIFPLDMTAPAHESDGTASWGLAIPGAFFSRRAAVIASEHSAAACCLAGWGLELGRSLSRAGAVLRVSGRLQSAAMLPGCVGDELALIRSTHGTKWSMWAAVLGAVNREIPIRSMREALRPVTKPLVSPSVQGEFSYVLSDQSPVTPTVSAVIPTLNRYSYLATVVGQLAQQTVPLSSVVVVDQTPVEERETGWQESRAGQKLVVHYLDMPGQCSARNLGMRSVDSEYVWFLDDDSEVSRDTLAHHLDLVLSTDAAASAGLVEEAGTGVISHDRPGASSGFPTNNCVVRRCELLAIGGFDEVLDGGRNEDAELGLRLVASGRLVLANNMARGLHHRAPIGGLRTRGHRAETAFSSRRHLRHRNIPSEWELYIARIHGGRSGMSDMALLGVLGTFAFRGTRHRRLAKVVYSALLLPDSVLKIRRNYRLAAEMAVTRNRNDR